MIMLPLRCTSYINSAYLVALSVNKSTRQALLSLPQNAYFSLLPFFLANTGTVRIHNIIMRLSLKYHRLVSGGCCNCNFSCPRCEKSYKSRGALIHHQRHECGVERRFCCEICGNRFKHKHHLSQHMMRIHHWLKMPH